MTDFSLFLTRSPRLPITKKVAEVPGGNKVPNSGKTRKKYSTPAYWDRPMDKESIQNMRDANRAHADVPMDMD